MYLIYRIIFELKELQKKIIDASGKTIFKPIRRKRKSRLVNKEFSIISNNCWGGRIYQKFDLPYTSPTVGVYFYADEYIKFLNNLEHYLSIKPIIIPRSKSKYAKQLSELKVYRYFPIGLIDDIEIVFLHYRSDEEAIEKWEKRKKRINLSNLIVKFNDQNECTEKHLIEFEKLPYKNKICFTAKEYDSCENLSIIAQRNCNYVKSDMRAFMKPINIISYINNMRKEDRENNIKIV